MHKGKLTLFLSSISVRDYVWHINKPPVQTNSTKWLEGDSKISCFLIVIGKLESQHFK